MKSALSHKKPAIALRAAENLLRGSHGVRHALNRIRREMEPAHFLSLIQMIREDERRSKREFHAPFARSLVELQGDRGFEPVSLKRELQWSKAYLRPFHPELATFVEYSKQFATLLIEGEAKPALAVLDEVESTLGYSLWSIKNRILLTQITRGLEAQKRLTATLLSQLSQQSLIGAVVHYVSQRSEPSVTAVGIIGRISKLITEGKLPEQFESPRLCQSVG